MMNSGTACSIFYNCIMQFDCSALAFKCTDASGKQVPMAKLQSLRNGCAMWRRLGFDWVCSCQSHDLRFQLLDHATLDVLANRRYRLELGDQIISGRSDENGMTEFVFDNTSSIVHIDILAEDIEVGRPASVIELDDLSEWEE